MIGIGLRSVSHAKSSSGASFGNGCSTNRTPFSFSQTISSSAFWRSFHPWFASAVSGLSVTERIVSIISRSLSRPSFTFSTLNSAASRTFWRTTSGVSMPIVKRGERRLRAVEAPDVVPGLVHQLADQVVQRDVHRRLRRGVAGRDRIDVGEDRLEFERVRVPARDRPSRGTPGSCPASRRGTAASTPRRTRSRRRRRSAVSTHGVVVRDETAT